MINFFRRIRNLPAGKAGKMADDNRPVQYMRYAIGEIFLVVIGILLALQINNWNDNRISKGELIYALDLISTDLNKDLNYLNNIILEGEKLDSMARIILNKTYKLDEMSVSEKRNLFFTGLQYSPFNYNTTGYEKINKLDGSIPSEYNGVIEQINTLYNSIAPVLIKLNEKQNDLIESRHSYLAQNKSWYSEFSLGQFTKEAEDFFTSDPVYINWISQFKVASSSKKNNILHALRGSVIATLLKVNLSLGKSNDKLEKLVRKVPEKLSNISGSYYSKADDATLKVEIIDGFLLVDGMVYTYDKELDFKSFGFGNKLKFTTDNNYYKLYTNDFFKNIEATQEK